jgi:tetratricopeptide (TPR) repeat protein
MGSLLSHLVLGAGVAAAVMLGGPASAPAQPASGDGADASEDEAQKKEAAKKLAAQAIEAQNEGDYDKAIELFRQAYALVQHPLVLFNVGQAHRLAGRSGLAIQFYERYLARDPKGKEATTARTHLATLQATGATGGRGEAVDAFEASAAKPEPAEKDPAPSKPDDDAARPEPEQPRTDTPARPGRGLRITGIVLGSAGLVSAAVGGYFTSQVLSLEDDAEKALAMGQQNLDDFERRGAVAQRNQDIAFVLAGGLIVGGVVTYYLGYRQGRSIPTTALAPVVHQSFTGVVLSGSLP